MAEVLKGFSLLAGPFFESFIPFRDGGERFQKIENISYMLEKPLKSETKEYFLQKNAMKTGLFQSLRSSTQHFQLFFQCTIIMPEQSGRPLYRPRVN